MELLPCTKRWFFLSLLGIILVLGGCGTSATSIGSMPTALAPRSEPTPTAPASRSEPTPSSSVACQTGQLLLAEGESTSNLGNAGVEFFFENHSRVSCTLFGYPALQLLDAQHQPIKALVQRSTSGYLYHARDPLGISMHPGQRGYFAITWANLGCGDTTPLSTTRASFLLVTPPLNRVSILVANGLCAYGNRVTVSPVEPGRILGVFVEGGAI